MVMKTEELIEALDQRYGNPYAAKECGLIQEAVKRLRELETDNKRLKGFCWETDEAKEFLESIRKAQEK